MKSLLCLVLLVFSGFASAGDYFANGICGYRYVEPVGDGTFDTPGDALAALSAAMVSAGCSPLPQTLDDLDWSAFELGDAAHWQHFTPPDTVSDQSVVFGNTSGRPMTFNGASSYMWAAAAATATAAAPVPEPSQLALVVSGLCLLVGAVRGRQ